MHPPVCPGSASGHPLCIQQWRPNGAIAVTRAGGGRGGPRSEGEASALLSFIALASAVYSRWSFRLEQHVLGNDAVGDAHILIVQLVVYFCSLYRKRNAGEQYRRADELSCCHLRTSCQTVDLEKRAVGC